MSKARYVTGLRAVEQLLGRDHAEIRRVYAEYKTANPRVAELIERARARGVEIQPANRARLQQISGEARHQGIVAEIKRAEELDEAGLRSFVEAVLVEERKQPLLLLILDGIQDPHNLGACLRTADAAGVDAVVVPRHGAAGLGPTVSKVAAGAAETLRFVSVANVGRVIDWLREYDVSVVGTSDKASGTLFDADLAGPLALVMGREETGLRPQIADRCDALVAIPMRGQVSSLNVSVATAVCLYEAVRQREPKSGKKRKNASKSA